MSVPRTARVIVLGNPFVGDDGAAMAAGQVLTGSLAEGIELILAGRPGPGLLDLLEPDLFTLLLDVTRGAGAPGTLVSFPLSELVARGRDSAQVSSHGLGPLQALRLAEALGRRLPPGWFLGLEGACFEQGRPMSESVRLAVPRLAGAARRLLVECPGEG